MQLGPGMFIGGYTPIGGGEAAFETWENWDNAEDGDVLNVFTDGNYWPATAVPITDELAIVVTNDKTAKDVYAQLVTRSGTTLTLQGTEVLISGSDTSNTYLDVAVLSPTRVLVVHRDTTLGERLVLLDVSGTSPVILDTQTSATSSGGTSAPALTVHSPTRCVLLKKGATKAELMVVDVVADAITFGAATLLLFTITTAAAIDALDETSGIATDSKNLYRYTISGTTITIGTAFGMTIAVDSVGSRSVTAMTTSRFVVISEAASPNESYITVWSWNGTTLIRGIEYVYKADILFTHNNGFSTKIDDNLLLFAYQDSSGTVEGLTTVVRINDNATVEVLVDSAVTFPNIQADHNDVNVYPGTGGVYALQQAQDDTTLPIKQVALSVLKGSSAIEYEAPVVTSNWITDVTSMSATGSNVDTSPPMTAGQGVDMQPDGLRMWQTGSNPDELHQYDLAVAHEPSSAGAATVFDLVGTDNCFDVQWSTDGMICRTLHDGGTQYIQQYLADTIPYEVGDLTYDDAWTFTEDSNPKSFWFAPNDTDFYINGSTTDTVYQFVMSTPGDIMTGGTSTENYYYGATLSVAYGVGFNPNQNQMILSGSDDLFNFDLGTAGDLGGTVTPNGKSKTSIVGSSRLGSFTIRKDNGSQVIFANPNTDFIHDFGLLSADPA